MFEQHSNGALPAEDTDDLEERLAAAFQSAVEWRERLGVAGSATVEDTARLLAATVPNAQIARSRFDVQPCMYRYFMGGPYLKLRSDTTPEEENPTYAWFIGLMLHGWRPDEPVKTEFDPVKGYDWSGAAERHRIGWAFADTWLYGHPKAIYAADHPRAAEILARVGWDSLPTLAEARRQACQSPDAIAVEAEEVTQPYVAFLKGLVVIVYPTTAGGSTDGS